MAVEDVRGALGECAAHLEFVGEQYTGPIHEELEKGVGHLVVAQNALQVAWEALMLADGIFHRIQNPSMEVRSRIRRAAQIAGQVATGSSHELIAESLPKNTADMVKFVDTLTSNIFNAADTATVFSNRVDIMNDDLKARREGWALDQTANNGNLLRRRSEEIKKYLEGTL